MKHIATIVINIYSDPNRFRVLTDYLSKANNEEITKRWEAIREKLTTEYLREKCLIRAGVPRAKKD